MPLRNESIYNDDNDDDDDDDAYDNDKNDITSVVYHD